MDKKIELCKHCGMDLSIRNPSGYCDHLFYPDYCEICERNIKGMDQLEAIKYLIEHSVFGNEWQGAGMFTAVEKVMSHKGNYITKYFLDKLLKEAEDY
jgi:hypothetical protein